MKLIFLGDLGLSLLSGSVTGFFGRFLGSEGRDIMTTTCVSFSLILSLIGFIKSHRELVLAI